MEKSLLALAKENTSPHIVGPSTERLHSPPAVVVVDDDVAAVLVDVQGAQYIVKQCVH